MKNRIKVSPAAAAQIRAAAAWWRRNRDKAPAAFREELERAFDLILALPSAGEPVAHTRHQNVRRLLVGRIRYFLYYSTDADAGTVAVLALWHTARGTEPPIPG